MGHTALYEACDKGRLAVVQSLLAEAAVDVNCVDQVICGSLADDGVD